MGSKESDMTQPLNNSIHPSYNTLSQPSMSVGSTSPDFTNHGTNICGKNYRKFQKAKLKIGQNSLYISDTDSLLILDIVSIFSHLLLSYYFRYIQYCQLQVFLILYHHIQCIWGLMALAFEFLFKKSFPAPWSKEISCIIFCQFYNHTLHSLVFYPPRVHLYL